MARLAVLDADVLIGHLDSRDAQHYRAERVLDGLTEVGVGLCASTVTLAEVLVAPEAAGQGPAARTALMRLGIQEIALGSQAAQRLAELRASTGCRLPDCCVLLAVQDADADLLGTFDDRLRRAAGQLGIELASTAS